MIVELITKLFASHAMEDFDERITWLSFGELEIISLLIRCVSIVLLIADRFTLDLDVFYSFYSLIRASFV
jgi:hypothetical protein